MTILKVRSKPAPKTVDSRVLSVTLTKRLHSYLSLYALTRGVTRTSIVRREMERWFSNEYITISENEILRQLVHKVQTYRKAFLSQPRSDEERLHWKTELESELRSKGIADSHIRIILSKIDET